MYNRSLETLLNFKKIKELKFKRNTFFIDNIGKAKLKRY
jgi:hypothetical protein